MPEPTDQIDPTVEKMWRSYLLTGDASIERRFRRVFGLLPKNPRCKMCHAPFAGIGSSLVRIVLGKKQSKLAPKMCNACEEFASRHLGGAEIELSMLFADVRGSTSLAERMSVAEFRQLIDRFYQAGTNVLVQTDALIDKLIGDQVTGLYIPGYAGKQHARRAIQAALQLLRVTGHSDPAGPWIPLGAGVHTGLAFVGMVGSKGGPADFTALGDAPNTAARLASSAGIGQVLVSQEAWQAAALDLEVVEERSLQVKGRNQPVRVHVLQVSPEQQLDS